VERRAQRANIPESQPNVDVDNTSIAAKPQPKKASELPTDDVDSRRNNTTLPMQKTKRQRAIEQEKEAKRSRKSSSTKKQNKDKPFVDDVSSEDYENPKWRTKGNKKTSSHTQTQKNRRDPEKSNVAESNKQVRKARKEKEKKNATKSI
jgi:hypothetical protein